jgi:hypothetical protein
VTLNVIIEANSMTFHPQFQLLCTICGKKFQKIWKVKEHMKEFHKIIEETIEIVNDKNIEIIT